MYFHFLSSAIKTYTSFGKSLKASQKLVLAR